MNQDNDVVKKDKDWPQIGNTCYVDGKRYMFLCDSPFCKGEVVLLRGEFDHFGYNSGDNWPVTSFSYDKLEKVNRSAKRLETKIAEFLTGRDAIYNLADAITKGKIEGVYLDKRKL